MGDSVFAELSGDNEYKKIRDVDGKYGIVILYDRKSYENMVSKRDKSLVQPAMKRYDNLKKEYDDKIDEIYTNSFLEISAHFSQAFVMIENDILKSGELTKNNVSEWFKSHDMFKEFDKHSGGRFSKLKYENKTMLSRLIDKMLKAYVDKLSDKPATKKTIEKTRNNVVDSTVEYISKIFTSKKNASTVRISVEVASKSK